MVYGPNVPPQRIIFSSATERRIEKVQYQNRFSRLIHTHTHREKERKKIYKKSRQRKTGGWPLLLLLPVTAWLTLGCFWEVNSLYSGVVVVVAVASSSSSSFYFILQSHQSPNASSRWL
jgi:hypothetical protein